MMGEEPIRVEGTVAEVRPNATFRVRLPNGHEVLAYLSRKAKREKLSLRLGDSATVEMSCCDLSTGRIVRRKEASDSIS
ncbi:MAG: translation initiation factor IF-1 [Verrucomicrobiae bacterium]|nr:translation initiation factor IF-1 [Verrucomicrobiae bacterium]